MQLREAYTVLGIEPGIGQEEIRSRYRLLVKELHPDVSDGHDEELGRIIEAYRLIDTRIVHRRITRSARGAAGNVRAAGSTRTAAGTGTVHGRPDQSGKKKSAPPRSEEGDAKLAFTLGRIAVSSDDRATRCRALERLARTGLRSAGVFIRQCLFDSDRDVAVQAARFFPLVPGIRGESVLIELVDQLTVAQCEAILDTIEKHGLKLRRFLAYASADPRFRVQRRAMEVLRGEGT